MNDKPPEARPQTGSMKCVNPFGYHHGQRLRRERCFLAKMPGNLVTPGARAVDQDRRLESPIAGAHLPHIADTFDSRDRVAQMIGDAFGKGATPIRPRRGIGLAAPSSTAHNGTDTMIGRRWDQFPQLVSADQLLMLETESPDSCNAFFELLHLRLVFRHLHLADLAKAAVVTDEGLNLVPDFHCRDR